MSMVQKGGGRREERWLRLCVVQVGIVNIVHYRYLLSCRYLQVAVMSMVQGGGGRRSGCVSVWYWYRSVLCTASSAVMSMVQGVGGRRGGWPDCWVGTQLHPPSAGSG